jgi:tetratricopeptide (TPR) repeat protein
VVAGFTARPSPSPRRTGAAPPERSEVESLLARGRFFWNLRTSAGLGKSMALFEKAVALAPLDPRAHEAMADACAFDLARAAEAEEHIGKALRLDADRAHPLATRGFVSLFSRSDLAAAGRSLRRALELDPADLSAHQWMAWWHAVQGHHAEARDEIEKALALDPVSLPVLTDRVKLAYLADVPVLAIELARDALELDPRRAGVHEALARVHAHARRWDDWLEAETARRSAEGEGDAGLARLRSAYAAGGPGAVLRPPPESRVAGAGMRYDRALAYSWLGEPERALHELQKGVEERGFGLLEALADPEFSRLRGPRFEGLRARLLGPAPGLSGR